MADAREEAALLRQSAAVADHSEGVHLEAVIVVESERLMLDDTWIELETTGCQSVAAARMAAVEYRHVIFLGQFVDGIEKAEEVLLGVYVLLAVGGQKNILSLLQPQPLMNIRGLDLGEVLVQHLGHRRPGHVGPLLRQAALGEVPSRVF